MKKYHDEIENYMVSALALERHYSQKEEGGRTGGLIDAREIEKSAYAATERRLYALPILRERIADNSEELAELENCGIEALRSHSASLVRLLRPGMRLTPDEIHAAQMAELRARLAADEREVKKMQAVLASIGDDPYYLAIELKYIQGVSDADAAKRLMCDPTTVRRNRARLVRRLAIRLYGSAMC